MNNSHYITSALPYVNGPPHLGHALELVIADTLRRWRHSAGRDVRYVTGSDENSLKNVQAARGAGRDVQSLVDENAALFPELAHALGVEFHDFVRTSVDRRHRATTELLWRACAGRGDIYRRNYRGLYCVGCEQFYKEEELDDGRCPEHQRELELVEEDNYFFRLSRYQDELQQLVRSGALDVVPVERRNEVLAFIEGGLDDFSISRSRRRAQSWGIPVPDDPDQVVYVWFDALGNYLAALGYAEGHDHFRRYWLECPVREHVIGKGILRFHAVYWPAILLSAGLPPPTRVLSHGYITVEGRKVGKSLGNALDPFALCTLYGADSVRYYLLRHLPTTKDGNFERARLTQAHDSELANQLGNLVRRAATLLQRKADSVVPAPGEPTDEERALAAAFAEAQRGAARAVDAFDLRAALEAVWRFVSAANRYADVTAPWKREPGDPALDTALYYLAESAGAAGALLAPFLPNAAGRIADQLGARRQGARALFGELAPGTRVEAAGVLFPKRHWSERREALC